MAKIKKLLTGKSPVRRLMNPYTIRSQQLAACLAWQILNDYPEKRILKHWDIYENLRGVMLADEVGGGKTFEALSVISKAFLENTYSSSKSFRFRVLILANPSIRSKWEWGTNEISNNENETDLQKFVSQTDLNSKLKVKLREFFSGQESIKSKKNWLDISRSRQGTWLSSFSGLPGTKGYGINSRFNQQGKRREVFPENFFDWIIVDEAHALKSGSKDEDEKMALPSSAIRKIYAVINSNKTAKVLLLTATPFQNNIQEFKHLLSLLEKTEKKNDCSTVTGAICNGLDRLEKSYKNIQNENWSFSGLKKLKNDFDNDINALLGLKLKNKIERPKLLRPKGVKNGLDDYMRDIMVRNIKKTLEIQPVNAVLDEKSKLQYLLFRDLVKDSEDFKQMFSTKLSQLVSSPKSFSNNLNSKSKYESIKKVFGGNLIFESKFTKLIDTIDKTEITNDKFVITVFVSWIPTIKILKWKLRKSGYSVCTLSGEDKTINRKKVLNQITQKNIDNIKKEKIILLASRVGNEGLDFDKFSNNVIHYDNNFNPAIIDQRNGRVYRNSNLVTKKGKVGAGDINIYQLFLEETYDQRILFIEKEKRKFKNFYLGDSSLQNVLEETIKKNKLKEEKEILKILDSIRIDLTPKEKYLLKKNRKEV